MRPFYAFGICASLLASGLVPAAGAEVRIINNSNATVYYAVWYQVGTYQSSIGGGGNTSAIQTVVYPKQVVQGWYTAPPHAITPVIGSATMDVSVHLRVNNQAQIPSNATSVRGDALVHSSQSFKIVNDYVGGTPAAAGYLKQTFYRLDATQSIVVNGSFTPPAPTPPPAPPMPPSSSTFPGGPVLTMYVSALSRTNGPGGFKNTPVTAQFLPGGVLKLVGLPSGVVQGSYKMGPNNQNFDVVLNGQAFRGSWSPSGTQIVRDVPNEPLWYWINTAPMP